MEDRKREGVLLIWTSCRFATAGLGRRRQEHADRPAALRHQDRSSRTSSRPSSGPAASAATSTSTSRCSPTACGPSGSRASRSTSPTATSPRRKRKFIIADTPGHIQYTRNMVTGASTADLALVLVDARKGMVEQSRRHAFLATLLRVPHLVLVRQQDGPGRLLAGGLRARSATSSPRSRPSCNVPDLTVIPVSALQRRQRGHPLGEHALVRRAERCCTTWRTCTSASDRNLIDVRFPVQYVIRPQSDAWHDYRGYAGQVAGGVLQAGRRGAWCCPSGFTTTIAVDRRPPTARSTRRSRRCR